MKQLQLTRDGFLSQIYSGSKFWLVTWLVLGCVACGAESETSSRAPAGGGNGNGNGNGNNSGSSPLCNAPSEWERHDLRESQFMHMGNNGAFVDAHENLHVVVQAGDSFYHKLDASSGQWLPSEQLPITAEGVAVTDDGTVHIVGADPLSAEIAHSFNTGEGWSTPYTIDQGQRISLLPDGNVLHMFYNKNDGTNKAYYGHYSPTTGWQTQLADGDLGAGGDGFHIAMDPGGNLQVMYRRTTYSDAITVLKLSSEGQWTKTQVGSSALLFGLQIDKDGGWHALTADYERTFWYGYRPASSSDMDFEAVPVAVPGLFVDGTIGIGHDGSVHVWASENYHATIAYTHKTPGGDWSAVEHWTTDGEGMLARVTSPSGVLHVLYDDAGTLKHASICPR